MLLPLHLRPLLARVSPLVPLFRTQVGPQLRRTATTSSQAFRFALLGVAGFGATAYLTPRAKFESTSREASPAPAARIPVPPVANVPVDDSKPAPAPESSFAPMELSFGVVCGFCAGVFVKKSMKAAAFLLGGAFVLVQYLSINSFVRVDWARIGGKFEQLFYRTDPLTGKKRPPTVGSLWNWLINFLTTDFQPRASFLAGIALGIRLG
ncbi:FUN14 family-domain-containing protein [Auriculariales sp. MPI-PUGE-AT-0066]|nr:FUN14 family-domain-containing protein [Auriculariales sp. MPI-PUGE-AT-0066]